MALPLPLRKSRNSGVFRVFGWSPAKVDRGKELRLVSADFVHLAIERQKFLQHLIDRCDHPRVAPISG